MATKKTANKKNESKNVQTTAQVDNNNAVEQATAQERKPLIGLKRYTDKADENLCYWAVRFQEQTFYFYTPNRAIRYAVFLSKNKGGAIYNIGYKAVAADVKKLRSTLKGEQLKDFNSLKSKEYIEKYGKITVASLS